LDPEGGDRGSAHSSPQDAIQCGRLVRAKYVALTHRAKGNGEEEPILEYPENVLPACDFLAFAWEECQQVWSTGRTRLERFAEGLMTDDGIPVFMTG
jgi:hypothetical protein